MSNISKLNREKMLLCLDEIASNLTDSSMLLNIQQIKNSLTEKQYGLIWEKHTEQVDEMLVNNIPVFTEDKSKKIMLDESLPYNFLLEGDNLHSLMLLEKAHLKVDIIYIDPPYNTLKKDFKYDDVMIDENDKYPHSKWLSFMERRLKLAYKLLKKDGIIFISIGDDEVAQLKLLCDEIFGEYNKLGICPRIAKKGSNKGTYFRPTKDYVLCYAKNKKDIAPFSLVKNNEEKEYKFTETEGHNIGKKYKKGHSLYQASLDARPNQRYYIEAPDGTLIIPPGNVFPTEKKDAAFVVPESNNDKCYRWSYESYLKHKAEGIIMFDKSKKSPFLDSDGNPTEWNVYEKKYYEPSQELTMLPDDVIYNFLNAQGQTELSKIGIDFSFSKPVDLIKYLITITNKENDITILDFFAGSGTTGQAVLELNRDDNGNRKFILCTNNEVDEVLEKKLIDKGIVKNSEEWEKYGICQSITYPRLKTIITGEKVNGGIYEKVEDVKKDLLYQHKISLKEEDIKNCELLGVISKIEELKIIHKDNYDKFVVEITDGKVLLLGVKNKIKVNNCISNLKYFKTDFVLRNTERVPDELAEHCSEMIELQKNINVESYDNINAKFLILKTDDEADYLYNNFDKYSLLKEIYIIEDTNEDDSVVLSNAQLMRFRNLKIISIPRWYFENEIRGSI